MKKSVTNHSSKSSTRQQEIDHEIERKAKRSRMTIIEDTSHWDCPLCTYRNRNESFKCEMCNVRKGTSTRKPRLTQVTQQFAKIENQIEQERKKETRRQESRLLKSSLNSKGTSSKNNNNTNKKNKFANASTLSITVKGVTVFIHDIELTSSNEHDLINGSSSKSENMSLEDSSDSDVSEESDLDDNNDFDCDKESNRSRSSKSLQKKAAPKPNLTLKSTKKTTKKPTEKSKTAHKSMNNSFEESSSSTTTSPDNSSVSVTSSVSLKKKTGSKAAAPTDDQVVTSNSHLNKENNHLSSSKQPDLAEKSSTVT